MSELTEYELKKELSENRLRTSYLIYGNEAYLKQHYANLIAKKAVSADMEGFNLRKFDAENNNDINELIESTDTLPIFSEHSCTFMKNFPLDSFYSADKEAFENWIKDMPETTVAVFWQDTDEINPRKNAKWKNVISVFTKYSASVCLDKMDQSSLVKTVTGGLKRRGCEIQRDTAFYLVDTVGDDLNLLLNEVEKLAAYKKGGVIERADIDAVCIKSLESNVFDLSKAILSKNLSKALLINEKLFGDRERPEMILGALAGSFIDLYRVKASLEGGRDAEYLKDMYGYKNTAFRLRNAQRDARRLTMVQIKNCIALLSKADGELKSLASDGKIIIEKLIYELYEQII